MAMKLSVEQIADRVTGAFGEKILSAPIRSKHPRVEIQAEDWRAVATFLKHEPAFRFDWLENLSGIDYAADERMAVVVDLLGFEAGHRFAVKIFTPRAAPSVPSVADLWPAAGWHEREAFDLLGIDFPGHPDLRRILLADDWTGHPLRKDYVFPRQVHGIPGSVELDWQQKRP